MKKYLLAICLVIFGCQAADTYQEEVPSCLTCGDVVMGMMTNRDQGCPQTYAIWLNLAKQVCKHNDPCQKVCMEPLCLSNGLDEDCFNCLNHQNIQIQEAFQLCFDQ